jgi:hypothetical protein
MLISLDEVRAARELPLIRPVVTFQRRELDALLRIYSLMVGAGEWRDYALSHLPDKAVFSVFKRSREMPLFRVEKTPDNARKQGAFAVHGADGRILKRGHDVAHVVTVFERLLKLAEAKNGRF